MSLPNSQLAAFFETAQSQNFQLNQSELLLRHILLENGIIKTNMKELLPLSFTSEDMEND